MLTLWRARQGISISKLSTQVKLPGFENGASSQLEDWAGCFCPQLSGDAKNVFRVKCFDGRGVRNRGAQGQQAEFVFAVHLGWEG